MLDGSVPARQTHPQAAAIGVEHQPVEGFGPQPRPSGLRGLGVDAQLSGRSKAGAPTDVPVVKGSGGVAERVEPLRGVVEVVLGCRATQMFVRELETQ